MASRARKFKIGLFVVVSLLTVSALIIWLGASRWFERGTIVSAYFAESVQGLETDSPVKFRGVRVGRVRSIEMAPDGRLVEVTMSLDKTFKFTDDLGIKMNLLGLTGMKYLEMDTFRPEQQREEPALAFTPRNRVVPTYPSDMREIGTALDNVFQKVKALDVDQISNNLVRVTSRMDKALGELKLGRISYETIAAVKEVRETAKRVGDEVAKAQVAKHMTKSVEKATEFFEESAEAARSADRALRRADNNLNRLSQKLDRSADNILDFTRMIRQKPSSIFFGQEEKKEQKKP